MKERLFIEPDSLENLPDDHKFTFSQLLEIITIDEEGSGCFGNRHSPHFPDSQKAKDKVYDVYGKRTFVFRVLEKGQKGKQVKALSKKEIDARDNFRKTILRQLKLSSADNAITFPKLLKKVYREFYWAFPQTPFSYFVHFKQLELEREIMELKEMTKYLKEMEKRRNFRYELEYSMGLLEEYSRLAARQLKDYRAVINQFWKSLIDFFIPDPPPSPTKTK